ncbi:MAG: hypothetical protein JW993_02095 [Sedimentisphaerales bacterium]|nr:hypothetical protein [Sedimentisphaerales bacterium]
MTRTHPSTWRLDRRINLSALLQLATLASLIVGSWLNLQRQLDSLQRDVTMLLETQARYTQKLETLSTQTLAHEYRVQAIERRLGDQP